MTVDVIDLHRERKKPVTIDHNSAGRYFNIVYTWETANVYLTVDCVKFTGCPITLYLENCALKRNVEPMRPRVAVWQESHLYLFFISARSTVGSRANSKSFKRRRTSGWKCSPTSKKHSKKTSRTCRCTRSASRPSSDNIVWLG
jgi:hypothetical protein